VPPGDNASPPLTVPVRPFAALREAVWGVLAVAADAEKEDPGQEHGGAAVRRYLDGRDIEIIAGDITGTCCRLEGEDLVLTFIDTDNYTPATAAIDVARERTVPGGAIVFDHFTGDGRFRYTLGERIAGRALLGDPRWFYLHGTGVFYRQTADR
jgi:hypothetical protein